MKKIILAAPLAALALLQGWAAPNKPLYNWGPYERQIYSHFKGESPETQIQLLEQHAQVTKANGQALPPGYMAHLGLLYGKIGRDTDFLLALEEEKHSFPESTPYIEKLMKNAKSETANAKN